MTRSSSLVQALLKVRNRHLLAADAVLLPLAAVLAFALRLDSAKLQPYVPAMLAYALAAPLIKIPIFWALGMYRTYWQYADTNELLLLIWAAAIGCLAQGALFLGAQVLFPSLLVPGVPRSIPFIDLLLTLAVIAAPRLALRAGAGSARRRGKSGEPAGSLQHVLIAGAGEAGAMVLRELRQNPQTGLVPVGFVDDDAAKHGVLLNRMRVLGGREAIPQLVREHTIDQVIIAMPSATGKTVRELVDICEEAGVRARIVPGIYELLDGSVRLSQLRDVQIDDLLRRAPVQTDTAQVRELLAGKRVLVTGAGGSIGAELCRQILRCVPASLILLGHGENSIFDIHNELKVECSRLQAATCNLQPVIADIRFPDRLEAVFAEHRPEVVFHAAAHKHVPLMEDNIADAITNNVLGTLRMVEASAAAGASAFVLISTDKAVNPSSIMGATKRAAELIVQRAARNSDCAFVAVRFGNVLGSRGSVVPYFQKQIAAGGPVTVTHPEVRRYFMTIPEAVQLVLQAATMGHGGEVFVLDMGEPVRIVDLARDLIRLSGLEPDRDIEITFTGLRPGEKLHEELFGAAEDYGRTEHEKILRFTNGRGPTGDGGGRDRFEAQLENLLEAARRGEVAAMAAALHDLVPEYGAGEQEDG
jgi:FlaA1/EpsC-like NDP-sugar epimerase